MATVPRVSEPPAGTVTFLFTDIEGSTALIRTLGDDEYARLQERHRAIVRDAISAHGGHEVHTEGDSFFVTFARATDAVLAAISAQHVQRSQGEVKVRMGLHTGEAQVAGGTYVGLAVHQAHRIASAARGGQILASRTTREVASTSLPSDITFRALGHFRLRDMGAAQELFQLCHPDLDAEFPAPETVDAVPNNLPLQLTSFVGRSDDIAHLVGLAPGVRLITLLGAGGVGKTRLALQVAAELIESFPDGVWLAELAPMAADEDVPRAIVASLGWSEPPGGALRRLQEGFSSARALLIVDNCEHVLDGAAETVTSLLRRCPGLLVIATSREPLGVPGEALWPVARLPFEAASTDDIGTTDAGVLFVDRATLHDPSFRLDGRTSPAVAEICRKLDGLPLAIELAAPWLRSLGADEIATRLDDRLRMLTSTSLVTSPRQRSLQAALEWSFELLSDTEKMLFSRLWVFAGGFSVEAAEKVCGGDGVGMGEVLPTLARLVDKSLVTAEARSGRASYRLLESVREFSRSCLAASSGMADAPGEPSPAKDRPVVFRREGEYWTIGRRERPVRLKHTKGLAYLHRLIRQAGTEVHVMDLVGAGVVAPGSAGELIDDTARDAYRDRVRELREEIDEALQFNDGERAARAEEEMDRIADELAAALGLGGRHRRASDDVQRARMSATKAIRSAIRRIETEDDALAAHLGAGVRTGTFCIYRPDPTATVTWTL